MTIEKIDAENKAAIFQALVDTIGESISVLTKIDLESTMLYLAGCLVVAVQEKMLKEGISTDTEMDITSESGASITLKNIDKFDYKGDSQEEAGSVSTEEPAGEKHEPEARTEEELVELENALLDVMSIIYSENPVRAIQVAAVMLATLVHAVSEDQNFDPTVPVEISAGWGCVVEVSGAMTMGT